MFRIQIGKFLFFVLTIVLSCGAALGQSSSFTYQGRLTDGGAPANGNYDLQVALFDSETGGTQVGQTQTITNVPAGGGVFTVTLDFGPAAFPGAARFLEISMRPSGVGNYTLLTPRQAISSTPYAVRSLNAGTADTATNAQQLGNLPASTYVLTVDQRLSDPRTPTSGSTNYIQNTTTQQANSNFNISGSATVGEGVSAVSYKIKSTPVLSSNGDLGTPGHWVSIAPFNDVVFSPFANISLGSYLGVDLQPTILGGKLVTMEGHSPSFRFVSWDHYPNPQRWEWQATYVGGVPVMNLSNITSQSNPFTVLGNGNVGIGNLAPAARLRVEDGGASVPVASFGARGDFYIDFVGLPGGRFTVKDNGFVGIGTGTPAAKLDVDGGIRFAALSTGGTTQLCRNPTTFLISGCSSSLRYKTDLHPFIGGLDLVNRLHPITFRWKADQTLDLGFGAEDVAAVEPLLVTHNEKGEVEGVKYDRLSAVFINAFKEQQAQIERQQAEAKSQQNQIAFLRAANDGLNARLRTIEKALKKDSAARRHHSHR